MNLFSKVFYSPKCKFVWANIPSTTGGDSLRFEITDPLKDISETFAKHVNTRFLRNFFTMNGRHLFFRHTTRKYIKTGVLSFQEPTRALYILYLFCQTNCTPKQQLCTYNIEMVLVCLFHTGSHKHSSPQEDLRCIFMHLYTFYMMFRYFV